MSEIVEPSHDAGFDRAAAVTRSLLGYGVLAGAFYVIVGVVQMLARDGFDASRHALSLLANGSSGWVQTVNFVVTGLMVLAAAVGLGRALRPARAAAILVGVYGASVISAGVFAADPADGVPGGPPPGSPDGTSVSGVLHLAAGGIGFVSLAAATATGTVGIVLLWLAALVSWTWLAVASIAIYRTVPHPDADRRAMLP